MGHHRDIDTELGRLRVRIRGSGPPVLLWHSLYVDSRSFDLMLDELGEGFQAVLVDGPGHGRSPGPVGVFDLDVCANAATTIIDALELGDVDWVGNAWGGHVGVVLAARPSPPIRSLAAFCSPMQPVSGWLRPRLLVALYRRFGLRGPVRSGLLNALLDPEQRAANPELEQYVVETTTPAHRGALTQAMKSVMLERKSLVERLPKVEVPTLFVTGDNPLWPVQQAREQTALLPRGEFVHMPGVRHLPPLEDPAATAAILRSWLQRSC